MKTMKNILPIIIGICSMITIALLPGKAFAAGGASLSDDNLEISVGDTAYISINTNHAAGAYRVSSSGSVMANDSGFLDNSSATIGIYGASEGYGTVTVVFSTLATYDEEELDGTSFTVHVYVSSPAGGYAGDFGKGAEDSKGWSSAETETPAAGKLDIWLDDVLYSVLTDLTGVDLPTGFKEADGTFEGEKVKTAAYGTELVLYALQSRWDGTVIFRTYDASSKTFKEAAVYQQNGNMYYLLNIPEGTKIPEGYKEKELSLNNNKIQALVNTKKGYEDFYYIYAMNNGTGSFYSYDKKEGTLQRVVEFAKAVEEEPATAAEPVKKASAAATPKIVLGIVAFALLALILRTILMIHKIKKQMKVMEDDY